MTEPIVERPQFDPLDVVLVGAGERARAWLEPLRRSRRLRLVGTVARGGDSPAPELPTHRLLSDAIAAHPGAAFALALPPRSALAGALALAAAGLRGVVEAPLHDSLGDVDLPPGCERVRVAHGWVTLPGRKTIEKLLGRVGSGRIAIEIAGLPESEHGEVSEALVHGLALVRSLLPEVAVEAARSVRGGLEVDLAARHGGGRWEITLQLRPRGRRLSVRIDGAADPLTWSWQDGRETVMLGGRAVVATREVAGGAERALAQLIGEPGGGDDLFDAAQVLRLKHAVEARLPSPLPPSARMLRQSAAIAERRPADLLARLGLQGEVPVATAPPPGELELALPPEPFELWAFRAGLKPVVFLTVLPSEVERTVAWFGEVHCERRDRLVSVAAQDRWTDRRDRGEARVELYLSRQPELAKRAAHLQAEADPSEAIRELGELVGYPRCCVEAFAEQEDRANNSLNRYGSWSRTMISADSGDRPWPWELNNLYAVVAPFYPCTYECRHALGWARAALAEMAKQYPAQVDELAALLARPVLYFDHDHQVIFEGKVSGGQISYRGVSTAPGGSSELRALAAVVAGGDRLVLDDRELIVEGGGEVLLRLQRTDPGLGFLAPFG